MAAKIEIKDYYRILNVSRVASLAEIKKAYHNLALAYHPDKSSDTNITSDYFLEIQEAYEVLSAEKSRKAYDHERRVHGLDREEEKKVAPHNLLVEIQELGNDVRRMNVHRVHTYWLRDTLIQLLSTQNVAILKTEGSEQLREAFLEESLWLVSVIDYPYPNEITEPLHKLTAEDEMGRAQLHRFLTTRKREYQYQRMKPYIAIVITMLICMLMYWYVQS